MQAEIITIGDEILIGQIVDSNSAFIAQQLNKIGVSVYQITSVQDDTAHILKSLKEAEENADIIILTGGLGPTKDDITKNTIATYFQDTLVQDASVLKNIETLWKNYIKQPLSQLNIDQALIPSKATALMNKVGSAPGMWLEKENKTFISLPGVPFEMKALIQEEVIPRLRKKYKFPYILHKTLLTYGIGESNLAEKIETWEDNLPKHIKLAYLPNLGKVRLRLSAKGNVKEEITKEVDHQINLLLPQIQEYFTGYEDQEESLEALIAKKLSAAKLTLATAESCTGGKIAENITAHAGASSYFKGSIVSYTEEIKINVLKVPETLIAKHSVVSAEVAETMARNVLQIFNTDFAIATTGNAGPTKDNTKEEIGTVFIAIATKNTVYSQKFTFGKPREKVINRAVNKALELLKKEIFKNR
ncbi:competence/damage-inducible protein A [Lacinutrix gracilariae]|uniref:CinA-like protein n=1 Tax=Lacinutrix gracilariae TaxID=1747198 RepID=A0ABW5K233_9FLAO